MSDWIKLPSGDYVNLARAVTVRPSKRDSTCLLVIWSEVNGAEDYTPFYGEDVYALQNALEDRRRNVSR